jgi:hypothetical protein
MLACRCEIDGNCFALQKSNRCSLWTVEDGADESLLLGCRGGRRSRQLICAIGDVWALVNLLIVWHLTYGISSNPLHTQPLGRDLVISQLFIAIMKYLTQATYEENEVELAHSLRGSRV